MQKYNKITDEWEAHGEGLEEVRMRTVRERLEAARIPYFYNDVDGFIIDDDVQDPPTSK